jgi:hypothetical protein
MAPSFAAGLLRSARNDEASIERERYSAAGA